MRPKDVSDRSYLPGGLLVRGGVTMGGGDKNTAYVLWDADELEHHRIKKAFESIDAIDEGLA